jgi:hypothetical protein
LIDMLLAPPEVSPGRSELASYFYLPWEPQRDWVGGYTQPGGVAADRIFIRNDGTDFDWFTIGDRRDQGGESFRGVEITVGGLPMFSTNQLANLEAFTVTPKDNPASFSGGLAWGWGEAQQFVSFALKRFSFRPGRCVAPSS